MVGTGTGEMHRLSLTLALFLFRAVDVAKGSVPFSELVDQRLWDDIKERLATATADEVNYADGNDNRGPLTVSRDAATIRSPGGLQVYCTGLTCPAGLSLRC